MELVRLDLQKSSQIGHGVGLCAQVLLPTHLWLWVEGNGMGLLEWGLGLG